MKTTGTILLVAGWLLGLILVCAPLVYATQSGSFTSTIMSTWAIWVIGIVLFVTLTELGKHMHGKEANNADK